MDHFPTQRAVENEMSAKRMDSLRLIWLEALVLAVEMKSYKKAGEELGVDPTVIAKYVKSLENWLDRPLIRFFDGKMLIYEDAVDFLPKAKTIIDILYSSRDFVIDQNNAELTAHYMGEHFKKHLANDAKSGDLVANLLVASQQSTKKKPTKRPPPGR